MQQKCTFLIGSWLTLLLFAHTVSSSLSLCHVLSFSLSLLVPPLPIHLSFPGLFICRKLDDTTSPWTWLALCQLSYRLLFHEHHHYYFSSLLLSLILFFFFLTHSLQHQWLKFMSNSMTTLTEVFNSFKIRKSAFFFPQRGLHTYNLSLIPAFLKDGNIEKRNKLTVISLSLAGRAPCPVYPH